MEKTYYEMLGLKEGASVKDINKAYRRWLFVYHLYKNSGDNKFEKIFEQDNEVYQTLSNRVSRIAYNTELRKMREDEEQSENVIQDASTNRRRKKVKTKSNAWYGRMVILMFFLLKLMFNLLTPPAQSNNVNSKYVFTTGHSTSYNAKTKN